MEEVLIFEKDKSIYMIRAIADELSAEHRQFIYMYLMEQNHQLTDYLQIFEFYICNNEQWLIQRQEQPLRKTKIHVKLDRCEPINEKVWMIDQGSEGIIVLLPSDY